jgi:hypothetical protein
MKITVNALLSMQKSLKTRLSQLTELRNEVSKKTTFFDRDQEQVPLYDVKAVDKKITELNKALFKIDSSIKESNAKTKVDIDINYDELIGEI